MKFKPGDLVVCKVSEFDNETVGKIYKVSQLRMISGWVYVEKDDNNNPNVYREEYFELAYPVIFNNKLEEILNE